MFVSKLLVKLAFYFLRVLFLLEAERGSAGLYQQHLGVPGRQIQSSTEWTRAAGTTSDAVTQQKMQT